MEPLECYTFKVEPDSSIEEYLITGEMMSFQDDPIKGRPIETEPFQGNPIEACPIRTEKNQDKPIEEYPTTTEIADEGILPETPYEEDALSEDPLMPTLRRQCLDSQAKLMILNVHRYFQKFRLIRAKETGKDMNVNMEVARATGVSESAVKKIYSEYQNKGIERAIRPPLTTKNRRRKSDLVVDEEEESPTITVKNRRKRK